MKTTRSRLRGVRGTRWCGASASAACAAASAACASAACAALAMLFLVPPGLAAQTIFDDEGLDSQVQLDWMKPVFEDADGVGFFTFAAVVGSRTRLRENLALRIDIPLSRASFDPAFGDAESGMRIGNPLIGVRYAPRTHASIDFLVRAPVDKLIGDVDPTLIAVFTDFDRFEAYTADTFSAEVRAQGSRDLSESLVGRAAASMVAHHFTDGGGADGTGFWLRYEAAILARTGRVTLGPALTGRFRLDEEGDLGQRSVHHLAFGAEYETAPVAPFARVRLPLDEDFSDALAFVLSLGAKVVVR